MAYADLKNKLDEYDWDDGFKAPRTILADPDCDLALALEISIWPAGMNTWKNQREELSCKSGIPLLPSYIKTSSTTDFLRQMHRLKFH